MVFLIYAFLYSALPTSEIPFWPDAFYLCVFFLNIQVSLLWSIFTLPLIYKILISVFSFYH